MDGNGKIERLPMAGYYEFYAVAGNLYDLGDLNMDGTINVQDIILLVNIILSN